jgi:hypothetical protein
VVIEVYDQKDGAENFQVEHMRNHSKREEMASNNKSVKLINRRYDRVAFNEESPRSKEAKIVER